METFSSFIDGLYDTATGVFDAVADYELGRADLELEKERRKAEVRDLQQSGVTTTASENGGVQVTNGTGAGMFGMSTQTLLLIGAGALVLILLLRR